MLNRDQIVEKLESAAIGNRVTAEALADLFISMGPSNFQDMQCNFSALMYILTEQQAIIGRLLEELIQAGVLNTAALERVTDIYGNNDALTPVYSDIYKRFAWYFLQIKEALASESHKAPESWNPVTQVGPSNDTDPA